MIAPSLKHNPVTRAAAKQLTRHGLWGHLPRPVARAPVGKPMLGLSFDLDYQADTDALPTLIELMDAVDGEVNSTLFCIGKLVEQDPGPYREACEQGNGGDNGAGAGVGAGGGGGGGHELANHTWSHPNNPVLNPDQEFWHLSISQIADELARCQDALERHTGCRPVGFRTPHFKDTYRMMAVLSQFEEITYLSTALASKGPRPTPYFPAADDRFDELALHRPGDPNSQCAWPQLMIPLTPCPGMRWSPFCSYSSIRRPTDPANGAGLHTIEQWGALWQKMLGRARRRKFASVYFDPLDVMRDAQTRETFKGMLQYAVDQGWEVTSLAEVERRWRPEVGAHP